MWQMELLITARAVSELSRDMSQHVDEKKIMSCISESENIDLKAALGDALFLSVKKNPEKYEDLLHGCEYEDSCGVTHVFNGLESALAYYSYARLVKCADDNVTRFGFVNKESEWSARPSYKEKMMAYNDAFAVADRYLKECLLYIQANKEKFPEYKGGTRIKANRVVYKIIGD